MLNRTLGNTFLIDDVPASQNINSPPTTRIAPNYVKILKLPSVTHNRYNLVNGDRVDLNDR